jgi:hypothetical protein
MDVMLDTLTTLSAGTLVDAALNVVGFLAAGGFFLVISSMVRDRQARKATEGVVDERPSAAEAAAPAVEGRTSLSFVSLASERPGRKPAAKEEAPVETAAESMRRNRAEVINLARKMIAARESREAIAGKLPISEAELSMLSEQ